MSMNHRRSFLKSSAMLASALTVPAIGRAADLAMPNERTLRMYNTHTGESLKSTFWAEGKFIPDAMADINKLLRDHRNNKIAEMDPKLLFLLDQVSRQVAGSHGVVHIISGYRSPESNQLLHETTNGVAKHSMHLDGKAIDVRMPGTDLAMLHKAALHAGGGGVGYYPDSQFVHMDTGRLRHW
ncbi:DUF882 domain-containing protein [Massilia sp. R2A-15]|uniref:DUF882 domain-containing protein n=1 Tax=Massilia sp. R2A-15 TaxID=3064278 RepID=UPI0027331970|nr:DUF882 domain-containing protein [Massilia sp. R2A-15]WLI89596.1 DUF882 domain-containing protein [Massilia sp. R2A-15]